MLKAFTPQQLVNVELCWFLLGFDLQGEVINLIMSQLYPVFVIIVDIEVCFFLVCSLKN